MGSIATKVVFLTGFMGTGKTAVGRVLARRLGRPFVDTDAEIERAAGMTIAELFRTRGEPAFRELERQAIADACGKPGAIVATGGGAILDPGSRSRMEAAGVVVCLEASPEVIWKRVGRAAGSRPLLADAPDPLARIRELLALRAPAYESIAVRVDASSGDEQRVADEIVRRLGESE